MALIKSIIDESIDSKIFSLQTDLLKNDFKNKSGNTYYCSIEEIKYKEIILKNNSYRLYTVKFKPICMKTLSIMDSEILHTQRSWRYYWNINDISKIDSNFIYRLSITHQFINCIGVNVYYIKNLSELSQPQMKQLIPKIKKTKDKKLEKILKWMDFDNGLKQL